jgi:hypothetical protein
MNENWGPLLKLYVLDIKISAIVKCITVFFLELKN